MWLNDKEEYVYGPFSDYVESHESEKFKFKYSDGTELIVEFETEYESENGLDLNDDGYEEYWEMAFKILKILKDNKNTYSAEQYVLVNYHNIPQKYEAVK